jgi:hypothetical protein
VSCGINKISSLGILKGFWFSNKSKFMEIGRKNNRKTHVAMQPAQHTPITIKSK